MVDIITSDEVKDLEGIIALQKQNLKNDLSASEIKEQGFVTVSHSLSDLEKMHLHERNIIAKDNDRVIAYVLGMTEKSKKDIPLLIEMYESFDHIPYKGKAVSGYNYIVVGQVCVDKNYRGLGLFDKCYQVYKVTLKANTILPLRRLPVLIYDR